MKVFVATLLLIHATSAFAAQKPVKSVNLNLNPKPLTNDDSDSRNFELPDFSKVAHSLKESQSQVKDVPCVVNYDENSTRILPANYGLHADSLLGPSDGACRSTEKTFKQ